MIKYTCLSILAFGAVFSSCSKQESKTTERKLVWSDEFEEEGLPDSTKWAYKVGGNGWGNNELEYYTEADSDNAFVKEGILHIRAVKEEKEGNDYTSARLVTQGKAEWTYGKFEVRAKLPKGRGLWPAIWMLGKDIESKGWPLCGEIDIMENVGYDLDTLVGTIHCQAFNHVKGTQKSKKVFIDKPADEFHVYAIDWTKDKIDFLLDDKVYYTVENTYNTEEEWPFNKPFYLILNVAVGGNWGGQKGVDDTVFPQSMEVDWVRVWQKE
ncbi:glycoside hydrolase family 16 protein [Marinilongibacter aquaticus]|uniref:glycoside hydrolase family 16 protein n=1 Tax=Marinilongibacter aquaticus TaxID=2975157 RepID=UPI0021BD7B0B|nr:glycoside hydrolase family 16 protein [Marinilongibacter aquaticus]UBM57744.1 glycoside hydrolase family 16 protein [Marinilongibacter aquaticus]